MSRARDFIKHLGRRILGPPARLTKRFRGGALFLLAFGTAFIIVTLMQNRLASVGREGSMATVKTSLKERIRNAPKDFAAYLRRRREDKLAQLQKQLRQEQKKLRARKEGLEKEQRRLQEKEQQIAQEKQSLKKEWDRFFLAREKVKEQEKNLKDQEARLAGLKKQKAKEAQEKKIAELTQIYKEMSPDQAAQILLELDTPIVVGILQNFKPSHAARVLQAMPAEEAARITNALTKAPPKEQDATRTKTAAR